ncbi:MAG: glycosyltransferase family 2 protein [Candidatus Magasanikbacteria bacterium]|nr:glycosyltransferase family 2 protein [Candidatus Magasanikbacteria bacterium]
MNDITITIVNYLMKDEILKNLESLALDLQNCPYKVHVVVVDNSENKDGIKEVVEKFPNVSYLNSGNNIGFGKAHNLGFKSVPARYYFALNPDTTIMQNSNTVERIIKFMDRNSKIGCIGPKLINLDGSYQNSCYRFNFSSIIVKPLKQIGLDKKIKLAKKYVDNLLMKGFCHTKTIPVDWVMGAALVIRAEVVEKVGMFDGRYFMYLEDADLCKKSWEAGYPVYYVHDIVIKHSHRRGSAKTPGVFRALIKNKLARIHLASWSKYIWKWRNHFKYYAKIS